MQHLFYGFPALRRYQFERLTGSPPSSELDESWVERWVIETYLKNEVPVGECLSICCGFGALERRLHGLGAFRHCAGLDLAEEAIRGAREAAHEAGIRDIDYRVEDVDRLVLEPDTVDLVWANGALHHLSALEHVVAQIYSALRPGGILVANEYVGPNHQQVGFRQRELINAVIHLIPQELRTQSVETFISPSYRRPRWKRALVHLSGKRVERARTSGISQKMIDLNNNYAELIWSRRRRRFVFGKVWDVDPWYFRHVDPSEGVRSEDIIPAIRASFSDVRVHHYNGSLLLHAIGPAFYANFNEREEKHQELLKLLVELEDALINIGEIGSDHAVIVASKPHTNES